MTTTKALILTGVIVTAIVVVVLSARAVSKNNKRSFGDPNPPKDETRYSFKEVIKSITNQ